MIDPTKVVRSELENGASVAILWLTSDALVAEKPKEERGARGQLGGFGTSQPGGELWRLFLQVGEECRKYSAR